MSNQHPILKRGEVLVGFSTAKRWNPLSAAIRAVTGAPCSHAWLLFYDERLHRLMVMEAHVTFQVVPYENWLNDNEVVALVHPAVDLGSGLLTLADHLGTAYNIVGLLEVLPLKLARWIHLHWRRFKLRLRHPLTSGHSLFCSQAVVVAMHASGYPDSWKLDADSTSPADLFQFFREHHAKFEEPQP